MRYLLYGLAADTDRPIPGLPETPGGGAPDVRLCLGAHPEGAGAPASAVPWYVADREAGAGEPSLVAWRDAGWIRLRYADETEFTVDAGGTRVGATWRAPMTAEDMATYLLGPVMGLVLRLRGVTCLHASAVEAGDAAFLVCGPAGAGKSTTAAAFASRGRRVLGDDVAALDGGGGITVRAAYPHLRLWPDAVRALYGASAELPALTPNWEKRYLDLHGREDAFRATPLAVRAVYLLAGRETADAPRIEPLAPAEAQLILVANTYLGWLPDLGARGRDLALYGRLAREVAVVRAVPHADAARLPALCAAIEADFAARAGEGGR